MDAVKKTVWSRVAAGWLVCAGMQSAVQADSPWASEVVAYAAGTNVARDFFTGEAYTNTASALGMPTRNGFFGGDITVFSGPFMGSEIVSLGSGGFLTVKFDHAVSNDTFNPLGADLIVFGNSFCKDVAWPSGQAAEVDREPGRILVSQDGTNWHAISSIFADDGFPTQGYTDTTTAYGSDGTTPTDFLMPVDTNFTFAGKYYPAMRAHYNRSGGGAPVDIAETGLEWIQYVMITQALGQSWSTEIDGFSDVAPVVELDLVVQTEGRGTVDPAGGLYEHGTNVTLTAIPGAYFHFAGWTGNTQGDTATNTMTLHMNRHRTLTARFAPDLAAYDTPIYWLAENGLTNAAYPTFDAAAAADLDTDGFSAWQEFLAGTDAGDRDSYFRILDSGRRNGTNYVTWTGGTNGSALPFRVERTACLTNGWTVLNGSVGRDPSGTNTLWYPSTNAQEYIQIRVTR